jgi:predicted ATP-binding protein involved in virulence
MRVDRFRLENYGPIQSLDVRFAPRFNVIAGTNGAGKTSILNALSVMLSRYVSAVRTGRAAGLFPIDAIRNGARAVEAVVEASDRNRSFRWSASRGRPLSRANGTDSSQLIAFAHSIREAIESDPDGARLPLVAAYSVNRAVLDVPLRIRKKSGFDQHVSLEGALQQGSQNFGTFFAWFRAREDIEKETRLERRSYRDTQLNAIRKAIEGLIPGFKDLRVRRQPLRMLVTKDGSDLRVDQLSDGEKTMLALAGDLARRLALANPGIESPLLGSGVVLIDELELHLHPAWQRRTVGTLQKTFPNCQFIVTTHSPQIISEVEANGVFLINQGKIVHPHHTFGMESGLVLEELMDTGARPAWAREQLKQLYEFIDDGEMGKASQAFRGIARQIGEEDPALSAARVAIRRKARSAD